MTTKIKVASTNDVFMPNDVLNFSRVATAGYSLAGATWVRAGLSHFDAIRTVLRFVYDLILHNLGGDQVWLLVGTATWQHDNRITRHKKLWGALKARGVEIPGDGEKKEVTHERDGRIKFFGAVKISAASLDFVAKAIIEERCAYVVAAPEESSIDDLLGVGWSGDFRNDDFLRNYAAEHEILIFKRIGDFDDAERGLATIGRLKLIKRLMS